MPFVGAIRVLIRVEPRAGVVLGQDVAKLDQFGQSMVVSPQLLLKAVRHEMLRVCHFTDIGSVAS